MSEGEKSQSEPQKGNGEFRKKWKKWIDKIGHDLGDLLISQDIIKEVSQIVASNKRIQSPLFFFTWIRNNYVDSIVVGLGRLNDHDNRTISFHNLIKEIVANPEAITRDYFVSRYEKWMQDVGIANDAFNEFADEGEQFLSKDRLLADLQLLDDETKQIKVFRDQRVAHLDQTPAITQLPTFKDVEYALELLDNIFHKYYKLIDGAGMSTAKPSLNFDWKEPLRYPWIEKTKEENNCE
jgi:hypothetical protein